ncbi:AAA family ATPase [Paenibacillus thalictri]|nr:AAA family ATPase [Paenibacillus thalictri]
MKTVYILSGPAGVGKSTTAEALTKSLNHSAYISGDDVSHMHIGGRQKPWESEEELRLIWNNILSLARNFVQFGNDVVIDYVTFPQEASWLREKVRDLHVRVVYVVLWTDPETLLSRDQMRIPEHRMRERCLILIEEFKQSDLNAKHLLDTGSFTTAQMNQYVEEIKNNSGFELA